MSYSLVQVDINYPEKKLSRVKDLARAFNKELGHTDFVEAMADQLVKLVAIEPQKLFLVVLEYKGMPVGLLGGAIGSPPFSTTKIAYELIWYIDPEHRGCRLALTMITLFEDWAADNNCKFSVMATNEDSTTNPGRLYERLGYKLSEKLYTKEL